MGDVENFARIDPPQVTLSGPAGSPLEAVVTVTPEANHPFRILEAHAGKGQDIRVTWDKMGTDSQSYRLTIENQRTTEGRYFDTVNIKTDNPQRPQLLVRVYGNIAPAGQSAKQP